MRFPNSVTVDVLRSGGRDARGNTLPEQEHPLEDCSVSPRSTSEPVDRSDTVVVGSVLRVGGTAYRRFTAAHGPLRSTDRIRVPDPHPLAGDWQVEGEPGPWESPFSGWAPGTRVALTRGTTS